MTNNKQLVIVLLLVLIVIMAITIYLCNNKEQFQYNYPDEEKKINDCAKSMDELFNLIESLKAANFPVELRQAYAMTLITEDPKHLEKVHEIINKLEITDRDKQNLSNIVFNRKGMAHSLKEKQAMVTANNIFNKLEAYENDMLYHNLSNN